MAEPSRSVINSFYFSRLVVNALGSLSLLPQNILDQRAGDDSTLVLAACGMARGMKTHRHDNRHHMMYYLLHVTVLF